jgi:hypothetical protein
VEIGVREGEEEYQLHEALGSVRLEDGRFVVLNAGSQELRYYDAHGRYLESVGRAGEGPGEFRNPGRLRKTSDGRLQVWDASLMRVSFFDPEGTFLSSTQLLPSGDEMFPGDDWILGQNWIESPLPPAARGPIRRAVEALPPPDSVHTLRILRVTDQGRIWTPRDWPPADDSLVWDVFDLLGQKVAELTTPPRFQPHEIGEDYLTGLFQDEMDVNYIRAYGLTKPPESPVGPGLGMALAGEAESEASGETRPPPSEEVLEEVRAAIRNMAVLEEIYYSENYTYTADRDALFSNSRSGVPEELAATLLFGGPRGWAGVITHRETGAQCILAYGYFVPMGWQPGAIICS